MISVKICGITSQKDAILTSNYGVTAIGLIFYQDSLRYVDPEKVAKWIGQISSSVKKVGVFVNEEIENVHCIARKLKLDLLQLHGDESPEYCQGMPLPVIKVFRVGDDFDEGILKEYDVHAFLFDSYKKGKLGGTGEHFNWELISDLNIETPILLSGGLNPENVLQGIETVNPVAVDVNSGVESEPGKKDKDKVKELFQNLQVSENKGNVFEVKVNV